MALPAFKQRLKISKREQWLIAAALAIALLYYVSDSFLFPYWDSLAVSKEGIDINAKRITNYRRLLLGMNTVKAALQETERQTASAEMGLLDNNGDALANAELQGLVKAMVTACGLGFRRSDLLPVKTVSPEYSKVSTRVDLTGGLDQVVALLSGLETTSKIIFVEELRISPMEMNNPKNKQVVASLMISALKRAQTGSPSPGNKS